MGRTPIALEAQQGYSSCRTILAAMLSQNSLVSVFIGGGGGGVSHNYREIRCKMGYRTDVPV